MESFCSLKYLYILELSLQSYFRKTSIDGFYSAADTFTYIHTYIDTYISNTTRIITPI